MAPNANLKANLLSMKLKWIILRIYIPKQIICAPVLACRLKSSETLLYEAELWLKLEVMTSRCLDVTGPVDGSCHWEIKQHPTSNI